MKSSIMFVTEPRADDGSIIDWRQHLGRLAEAGLQCLDVYPSFLERMGIPVEECLAQAASHGLRPAQYAVGTDFITPGADTRKSLDAIKAGCDACVKHGILQLFSHGGQHSNSGAEAMARYVEGLQRALEIAASAGLGFSIENAGSLCHTWEELLDCVTRVGPAMGVTYDGGNFVLAASDPLVAAEMLRERVVHVHLKNLEPAPGRQPYPFEYCPPDRGLVDYDTVVATLVAGGFDGCISFEPDGWPKVRQEEGVRFCRSLVDRYSIAV